MSHHPDKHRYTLFPVFLTYFLDNFGLGVMYPIFTPLFLSPHFRLFPFEASMIERTVVLGFLIASFPMAQFFGAPIIGEYSDRHGRKKAFFVTILGMALGYTVTATAILINYLPLLFFGRIWTGFFAGNLTLCLAAVADMSPDERSRAKNFGLIASIGGLSFILAILSGGIFSNPQLSSIFNPSLPFWITAFLSYLNLVLMILLFKESHTNAIKTKLNAVRGIYNIVLAFKIYKLRTIYIGYFFFMVSWVTSMQFLPTYLIEKYSIKSKEITMVFVGIGLIWSLSNLIINRYLSKRFVPPSTFIACMFALSFLLLLTLVPENYTFFLVNFYAAVFCGALSWTNGLATVSLCASENIQGSILGINQSMTAAAAIFGPLIGGLLAGIGTHGVYLFTGLSSLIGFLILWTNKKALPMHPYKNS